MLNVENLKKKLEAFQKASKEDKRLPWKRLDEIYGNPLIRAYFEGPKDISDTLSQAHGTASRATIPLFAERVKIEPITSVVDVSFCAGCGLCEQICEFRALKMDPYRKVMTVNEALCKGCGACNAACPSSAISLRHYKTEQIIAQIREVC